MINYNDILAILMIVFIEGILSVDNALVLALLVRTLPKKLQAKALMYGMVGAFAFRFLSLFIITFLMKWAWAKMLGGAYLLYLAIRHFFFTKGDTKKESLSPTLNFWKVIVIVELTNIAFSMDSILAAVALSPKFWIVLLGGILGIITMRVAAVLFIKLLEKFPKLETSAYLLITVIGLKLVIDAFKFPNINFHSANNFAFWIFWLSMLGSIIIGFIGNKSKKQEN